MAMLPLETGRRTCGFTKQIIKHVFINFPTLHVFMLAGEEVTISYIGDLSDDVVERHRRLQKGWEFSCTCPRCAMEALLPTNIKELVSIINKQMSEDLAES